MKEATLENTAAFLRDLGRALHLCGAPAHDLEATLVAVGKRLGVRVEGFAVLTFLALTVVAPGGARRVELLRLPPYDYNMARLIELQQLVDAIDQPACLDDYIARLEGIMRMPPPWSGWSLAGMGFLLSGAVAVLLRGGWLEMLCGGLIGMLFMAAHQQLGKVRGIGPAVPVILCALAAMLAQGLGVLLPQQSPFISALAGVVLLLPGFMLTVAMSELATQNFLAGSSRLAGAFMLLFLIGGGLVIGTQISLQILPPQLASLPTPLPGWVTWPAIALLGVSLLGVIQAPLSSLLVSVAACLLAWATYTLVGSALGPIVGAFAGALMVGSAGHVYHALRRRPAVLVQIPGLITLVPGSMGFRGLHALMQQDSQIGIGLLTEMILTGAVLAVGMLLADNLVPYLISSLRRDMKPTT